MRKITRDAIQAFMRHEPFNQSNTFIMVDEVYVRLYLHEHNIATIDKLTGKLYINPCEYITATTKERLNGLPNVSIKQRDFVWYLNGSDKPMLMNSWTLIQ